MPLYETIIIGRCNSAKASANLLRLVSIAVLKEGAFQGNVRELNLLGDRVLAKNVRGNDQKKHILGRYMQIVYDGDVNTKKKAETAASESYETLRYVSHKMKDYYNEGQIYRKSLKEQNLIVDEAVRDREYIQALAKLAKDKNFVS